MRELELAANSSNNNSTDRSPHIDMKRFPRYYKWDNVDSFLINFERTCAELGVRDQECVISDLRFEGV